MKSDIEIAQEAKMEHIKDVAALRKTNLNFTASTRLNSPMNLRKELRVILTANLFL